MIKRFIPKKRIDTVYSLDSSELSSLGIKGIIFDIDNTLESHRVPVPSEKVRILLERFRQDGFSLCLISNGKKERVAQYSAALCLPAVGKAKKPCKKNLRRAMQLLGTTPKETLIVGDQLFTDVYGGNRMGFYTILVEPIEQIENNFFYIKRFFERLVLKRIKE